VSNKNKKAASNDELAGLHAQVASTLVEDLGREVPKLEGDEEPETKNLLLRMQELVLKLRHDARAHAITFLKNNNITAAEDNAAMQELQDQLKKQRDARSTGIPQRALDDAADAYGHTVQ
jgi:hypothetical protein